jgi:hypothetical protein
VPNQLGSEQRTVSHLALMGFRPAFGFLHQYGIRPKRRKSSERSPVTRSCTCQRAWGRESALAEPRRLDPERSQMGKAIEFRMA